jgi:23S rRNA pseudouridine1911/1915/1917 synthase
MVDRLIVEQAGRLFDVLAQHFAAPGKNAWSKNTLRQRLRMGCVEINGHPVVRANDPVSVGDVVVILSKASGRSARAPLALPVLYEDEHLLVIDKPEGLLSVSTDEERVRTAMVMARDVCRQRGSSEDLWPVHRLDRETSGILMFARTRAVCDQTQVDWHRTKKVYAAVVEGVVDPAMGTVDQPLWEDKNLRVHVGARAGAKAARTHYETVASGRARSQLDVRIETGRKHQIRVHMAFLGHPIVGDRRYGHRDARLCLHARMLEFRHPVSNAEVCIESALPVSMRSALA